MAAEILEFMMLFLFGFSWPFAIARTYRAKRVDGKSPAFEIIVIVGYLCGIASHLVSGRGLWVIAVYCADIALVATDLTLYFHYSAMRCKEARAMSGVVGPAMQEVKEAHT